MDLSKPANTYVGYQKALENFFTPPKGESDDCPKSLLGQLKIISVLIWPEGGMKFEKLASTHVWNRKMRLKYRMMFPFVCADRYGPKQACKHICWVLKSSRKFFHATQR